MERSPQISTSFHVRILSLLGLLTAVDAIYVRTGVHTTLTRGASAQLVFAFEYAVLLTNIFMILVKYILHSMDSRRAIPWDRKSVFLLYAELVTSFVRLLLYTAFISLMLAMRIFALFIIRPTYLAVRAFVKATSDVIRSRIAVRNLRNLFHDASVQDLRSLADTICIICREDMLQTEGTDENPQLVAPCKKLPCAHIFHEGCLRSWFQRQQTCPTCRRDVVNVDAQNARRQRQAEAQGGQNQQQRQQPQPNQQQQQQQQPQAHLNAANIFATLQQQQQQQQQPDNQPGLRLPRINITQIPGVPMQLPIPSPDQFVFSGFPMPPPPPPFPLLVGGAANFAPMAPPAAAPANETAEQREKRLADELKARVDCLESVKTLLDAAVLQLQQYLVLTQANETMGRPASEKPTTSASSSSQQQQQL